MSHYKVQRRSILLVRKSLLIPIFLVGIILSGSGLVRGEQNWKEVTSKADQFSVLMPGEPKFTSESVKTALGPIEAHQWMWEPSEKTAFLVMVNQYPQAHVDKVGTTALFDGAQKGGLGPSGKLRSRKDVKVEGFPGRDVVIERDGHTNFVRFFLVKNRFYQLIVTTRPSEEAALAKDIERFDNSFKLLR